MDSLIFDVQNELTETEPNYKYTDYYKMVELQYWGCLPQWVREYNAEYPIKHCLDVGVAIGTMLLFTHKISNCKMYACEIEKHLSDKLIDKYNIQYEVINFELEKLKFKKIYDCIIFTEVLEHLLYNPLDTLIKLRKLLTKNGSLFLTTPNVELWGKLTKYKTWRDMPKADVYQEHQDLGHEYHFSKEEIYELVDLAGMKIVKEGYSPADSKSHMNFQIKKK